MIATEAAERAIARAAGWPGLRSLFEARYERRFARNRDANLFRGVFESFEAAQASAPPGRPVGYDNPDSAAMYVERTRKTYPTDYPVMFWLQRAFDDGATRVFDLGGHIGVSYYAYRRHLRYPQGLSWCVQDVPAVNAQGRKFAAEKDAEGRLSFADAFDAADGVDVLTAQGSLQYLPDTLAQRLAGLRKAPRHLLINLMPLHERHGFWTLQSVGTAFCPYRITAIGEFLAGFKALGYELVDAWDNPDKKCEIPFHPERSLERYHGFHFRRG